MKYQFKNYPFVIASLLVLFIGAGCKKQLDINQNPNYPTLDQGNPKLVFPAAVLATTGKVGGDLAIVGGMWSEFFTQASLAQQYTTIDSYNMPTTNGYVNSTWDDLFPNAIKNYQYIIDQTKTSGDWNYYLMATVMKAYTTEILVDLYDQIPYSESIKGASNLDPHFDDGYTVYTELINSIDTALNEDFTASTNSVPGSEDLVFGGDMNGWKAFANTLKLKMYLRMVNSHPDVAEAGVKALFNANAEFLSTNAGVTNFTDAPGLDNPLYEQNIRSLNTATNIKASTTFVSWLNDNNDPRIVSYFGETNPASINQGDYTGNNATYQAAPTFVQSPTDPVFFISTPESYFLQAEANVRYFGGDGAQDLYNQGVLAAFSEVGLDGSSMIADGGPYEWGNEKEDGTTLTPIDQIIRQKWAAAPYGDHGIEAFFDRNRTGFPVISDVYSTDPSYVPGQLVIAKNSVLPDHDYPQRFPFPYDEISRNKNAPPIVPITTPVWWAK
jgi:hypothetical protein